MWDNSSQDSPKTSVISDASDATDTNVTNACTMKHTFHHSITLQVIQLMQTLQFLPEKTIFPSTAIKRVLKRKACMVNGQRFALLPVTSDATDANVTHTRSVYCYTTL